MRADSSSSTMRHHPRMEVQYRPQVSESATVGRQSQTSRFYHNPSRDAPIFKHAISALMFGQHHWQQGQKPGYVAS